MRITTFSRNRRLITIIIFPILALFLFHIPLAARMKEGNEAKVANVRWATKNDILVVNYDLNGPSDSKYEIDIVMKNERDPDFSVIPTAVDGDIGQGAFAGANREIRWYYRHDYPKGFEGEGYYIEIHVKTVTDQSNLLYYIVGGAALTGGLIALVVGKGQSSTGNGIHDLPMPPARP
jgi:hypothetical protein